MDLANPWATSMVVPFTNAKAMACLWELWSSWMQHAVELCIALGRGWDGKLESENR
jgi:hypothetical protein